MKEEDPVSLRPPAPVIDSYLFSDDAMMNRFRSIVELDKLKSVFRRTLLFDKSRRENDAEHSFPPNAELLQHLASRRNTASGVGGLPEKESPPSHAGAVKVLEDLRFSVKKKLTS